MFGSRRSAFTRRQTALATGVTHCGYPGDTIVAHATNPYDGGLPLYIIQLAALPAGVTFDAAPNPQDGVAPNPMTLTIATDVTTPVGAYQITVDRSLSADGSNPSTSVSLPYVICDLATGTCPTPSPSPSPSPSDPASAAPSNQPSIPAASPSPLPTPTTVASILPQDPGDFADASTDAANATCQTGVQCVIQGHTMNSVPYINVKCSTLFPDFCAMVTSTYSFQSVQSGITYQVTPSSAVSNTSVIFTIGAAVNVAPGLYGPIPRRIS